MKADSGRTSFFCGALCGFFFYASRMYLCFYFFLVVIVAGAVAIQQESQLFESLLWLSRLEVLWSRSCMFVFCNCPYVNININHRSTLILKWPTNSILKNDLRGKIELLFQSQTGCWGIASQMWPPGGMFETLHYMLIWELIKWIDVFKFQVNKQAGKRLIHIIRTFEWW